MAQKKSVPGRPGTASSLAEDTRRATCTQTEMARCLHIAEEGGECLWGTLLIAIRAENMAILHYRLAKVSHIPEVLPGNSR